MPPRPSAALAVVLALACSSRGFAESNHAKPSSATGSAASRVEAGAALYAKYCAVCHGAHSEGYAADNAPSLSSPTFRATASDAFLRAAIERGRAGTAMAGYARAIGGPLAPSDVDALIAYVRGGGPPPAALPRQPSRGNAAKGATVFAANCQTCHGTPTQRGNAVHLANPMLLASASDAYLRAAILDGRPGTAMRPWRDALATADVEDVVAYLRSLARPVPPPATPGAAVAAATAGPMIENVPVVVNPNGPQADFTPHDDRYVSVADVARAYDERRRLVLVDARTTSDYLQLHIAGAISIPYFDMHDIDKIPNDGTWVITYCACPHHVSGIVMEELRKRGYAHSAVLDEGIFVWQQRGNPVIAAAGQLPVPAPPPPLSMPRALGDGDVGPRR